MIEATEKDIKTEIQEVKTEEGTEILAEKPYTFRELSSPDVFPMFKIISKIGVREFTAAIDKDVFKDLVKNFISAHATEEKEENDDGNSAFAVSGATVFLGVVDVILGNIPRCESDIYQLLSQTSNLSVDEIKKLKFATFAEMVIDFVKKDEFRDFIKVVLKLFR